MSKKVDSNKIVLQTQEVIDHIIRQIKESEEFEEQIYPTVEVHYNNTERFITIAQKMRGGAKGFAELIEKLKNGPKIQSINIKLFSSNSNKASNYFQTTQSIPFHDIMTSKSETVENSILHQNNLSGFGDVVAETKRQLEEQMRQRESQMIADFAHREALSEKDFELRVMERDRDFFKNEADALRKELSLLNNRNSELEAKLTENLGQLAIAERENNNMESLGLSGFKDQDWAKLAPQLLVAGGAEAVIGLIKKFIQSKTGLGVTDGKPAQEDNIEFEQE